MTRLGVAALTVSVAATMTAAAAFAWCWRKPVSWVEGWLP